MQKLQRTRIAAAAALVVAGLAGSAQTAGAQPGHPTTFGICAAQEAQQFPPGPEHGADLALAQFFNPSGENLQCTR
jgi:hypothetical protein